MLSGKMTLVVDKKFRLLGRSTQTFREQIGNPLRSCCRVIGHFHLLRNMRLFPLVGFQGSLSLLDIAAFFSGGRSSKWKVTASDPTFFPSRRRLGADAWEAPGDVARSGEDLRSGPGQGVWGLWGCVKVGLVLRFLGLSVAALLLFLGKILRFLGPPVVPSCCFLERF